MLLIEEWRDIECTTGYEVSNLGRVRSYRGQGSRTGARLITPRLLKPIFSRHYNLVNIDRKMKRVGVLVLEAFVGPRPEGMECCHGSKGQRDDSINNLSWDTHTNNMWDKDRDGTMVHGEECNWSKLTELEVLEIVRLHRDGLNLQQISDRINTCMTNVWHIVNGKTWSRITGIVKT